MVLISQYRGTTRYQCRTFNVSKYRLHGSMGLIHLLNFLHSNINYFFPNIISNFSLFKLESQREYRVWSIEYRTQFWYLRYQRNYSIHPALNGMSLRATDLRERVTGTSLLRATDIRERVTGTLLGATDLRERLERRYEPLTFGSK